MSAVNSDDENLDTEEFVSGDESEDGGTIDNSNEIDELKLDSLSSSEEEEEELDESTTVDLGKFLYKAVSTRLLHVPHTDITPMLNDDVPIVIDGDSLLIAALLNNNYDKKSFGQTLHFVYICERLLNMFYKKCKNVIITFVQTMEEVWNTLTGISLARTVLVKHLQLNTHFRVHTFSSYHDPQFSSFWIKINPAFLVFNLRHHHLPKTPLTVLTYFSEFLFLNDLNINLVDIFDIIVKATTINGFLVTSFGRVKFPLDFMASLGEKRSQIIKNLPKFHVDFDLPTFTSHNMRDEICINACYVYLKQHPESSQDWIRCFLFYNALLEYTSLPHRAVDGLSNEAREICKPFILNMIPIIELLLRQKTQKSPIIPDIWHGNFFVKVFLVVQNTKPVDESNSTSKYICLLEELNKLIEQKIEPFPIFENPCYTECEENVENEKKQEDELAFKYNFVLPCKSEFINKFCKPASSSLSCNAVLPEEEVDQHVQTTFQFHEINHWHCKKPLLDELKKFSEEERPPTDPKERYWYLKRKAQFAKYQEIYGTNLEGKSVKPRPIITQKTQDNKKKKDKSQSKKAAQIIEDNMKTKDLALQTAELEKLKSFEAFYWTHTKRDKYIETLSEVKKLEGLFKNPITICRILMIKLEILFDLWETSCKAKQRNFNYVDEFLLTIKKLLEIGWLESKESKNSKKQTVKSDEATNKIRLGKYLHELGFEDLAQHYNLPKPGTVKGDKKVGMSILRYQLLRLGPYLDRVTGGREDPRVNGFIPDPWQSKLFDIVDKNESALIVAPTSSGKTYAMYYCMEKVLRESDDGVVVYIAPTKALVNQVAATVYARFKNKIMPPGKVVYGVFTRDYRHDVFNSQILITVPEVLEILLISPRLQSWVRRLKYLVLDEIHCLSKNEEGITWERCFLLAPCPFLALSATIEAPSEFQSWLGKMQQSKLESKVLSSKTARVHLVVHQTRHADLNKFVYSDNALNKMHPYCLLDENIMKSQNGVPVSVTLSPSETLELYDAMSTVQTRGLKELIDYFDNPSRFITRPEVRKLEETLKALTNDCLDNSPSDFSKLLKQFQSPNQLVSNSSKVLRKRITGLLDTLERESMLPVIVFSLDRSNVEYFCQKSGIIYERVQQSILSMDSNKKEAKKKLKEEKQLKKEKDKVNDSDSKGKQNTLGIVRSRKQKPKNQVSLNLLEESCSPWRGVGTVDKDDIQFIERRLIRQLTNKSNKTLFCQSIKHGFGMHHGGLGNIMRSSCEMLYRLRVINCVYATSTLALGIHTPCKTVVIAGDSPFLNSLEFHQMSGRAGRRGFDNEGNVIIFGLSDLRTKVLLTASLPKMVGNFPASVSFVLRVLVLLTRVEERSENLEEAKRYAEARCQVLLNHCLSYESTPGLHLQMRLYFYFATQLLMLSGLLDVDGSPQFLAGIVTHLSYLEPGNLAFVHLFKTGTLRKLCVRNEKGKISEESLWNLMIVLNFLFARKLVNAEAIENKQLFNSIVVLPQLPDEVVQSLTDYNATVKSVFFLYYKTVAEELPNTECTLPLSGITFNTKSENNWLLNVPKERKICSTFASLSCCQDINIFDFEDYVSCIRHDIHMRKEALPLIDLNASLNSYALDFYNHGILSSIRKDNMLKAGEDFALIKDFMLMLRTIKVSLDEFEPLEEDDVVFQAFTTLADKFESSSIFK